MVANAPPTAIKIINDIKINLNFFITFFFKIVMVGPTLLYRFSVTPVVCIMLPKLPVSLSGMGIEQAVEIFKHVQPFLD